MAVLVALLIGLAVGKAWERYKLRDGRWIDRRRLRETPHYMLGLNFLVDNQVDQAIDELTQAASTGTDALEIQMILGNLYRQKGQVGRAINLHQSLLQRPTSRRWSTRTCCSAWGSISGTAGSSTARSRRSRKSCISTPGTATRS